LWLQFLLSSGLLLELLGRPNFLPRATVHPHVVVRLLQLDSDFVILRAWVEGVKRIALEIVALVQTHLLESLLSVPLQQGYINWL
jgi:hypothetical protein